MYKNTIAELLNNIKQVISPTDIQVINSSSVLSSESYDPIKISSSGMMGSIDYSSLSATFDSITNTLSIEELNKINPEMKQAAVKAAILANSGNFSAYGSKIPAAVNNGNTITASVEETNLSIEGFDPSDLKNSLYFTYIINILGNKQDEFAETFFPTIVIDPTVAGLVLNVEVTNIYKDAQRNISGAINPNLIYKYPLIKSIYNSQIMSVNSNKVVPVLRPESEDVLVKEAAVINTETGETITTAPIKLNKPVDLLALSSTDAILAKGLLDNTDTLDRSIKITSLTYTLSGTVNGTPITEYFTLDIGAYAHTSFVKPLNGHNKGLALNFPTQEIIIKLNTTTFNGTVSQLLSSNPSFRDLKVKIKLSLAGNVNTQTGEIAVSLLGTPVIEGVYGANGVKLPGTSQLYLDIKAILDTLEFKGYTVEAYRTNSNFRTRAQALTVDSQSIFYPVPIKQGTTITTPLVNMPTGVDGDANKIANTSIMLAAKMSSDAVDTLIEYADLLSQVVSNIETDGTVNSINPQLLGIGENYVNRYFRWQSINLIDYVDSVKSSDRYDDVRLALINTIRDLVIKMSLDSNYYIAYNLLMGNIGAGNKINVILGTDPEIKNYLTNNGSNEIDIGADYKVTVVSTPNPKIHGQIFLTFTMDTENKNSEPNPLSFGSTIMSPAMSFEIQKSGRDGASVMETHVVPRYQHYAWLPVLTRISVVGLSEVLRSVPVKTKAI